MPSIVGFGLGKLLGSGKDSRKAFESLDPSQAVTGFGGGGLSGVFSGGQFQLSSSPERQAAISGLQSAFTQGAGNLAGLRSTITPGEGLLSNQVGRIFGNVRRKAVGNLRENLARRRILGSSFAADKMSGLEAEIAQQEQTAFAEATFAELDATFKVMQAENQAITQAAEVGLKNLNLEAGLAANMASIVTQVLGNLATEKAQLFKESAIGKGELGTAIAGDIFGPLGLGLT